MGFKIAFYVHHHGSGHFTRTAQILTKLNGFDVTLLGSNLKPYAHLLPEKVNLIHLPMDTPVENDIHFQPGYQVDALHYAPLNVKGITERVAILTNFFSLAHPMVLVVDVSVEVTLLARLCSIPSIVMRQHGNRDDLPHLMAFQSAELLIAPFSESIAPKSAQWINDKTTYVGGFSRFTNRNPGKEKYHQVAIMVGSGGTSINTAFITFLASNCVDFHFRVIGEIPGELTLPNVTLYGHLDEPEAVLEICSIVIGNTGHNTVMEMASLNKCFIGIPEERPFEEQVDKANAISALPGVQIILPESIYDVNWHLVLSELEQKIPNWDGIIAENALDEIAAAIIGVGRKLFK